ncbi:MAG: hypothetical protein ACR2MP_24095 [Streptosporangiaceae bacterium]
MLAVAVLRKPWRALAVTPLILLLTVALTSCAQIMRDDSGGQPPAPAPSASGSPPPPVYYYTYYVSPSGSNSAAGTSPWHAWRTLSKASSVILRSGTRVLLQGGQKFTGELRLSRHDGGSASHPVLVGSYGHGRATIVERKSNAISITNTAGVVIQDLSIVGRGLAFTYGLGIAAYSSIAGTSRLDGLRIENVSVSGSWTASPSAAPGPQASPMSWSPTQRCLATWTTHDDLGPGV